MTKKKKQLPHFKSEEEEKRFWDKEDTAEYFDLASLMPAAIEILPKTPTKSITIRLPLSLFFSIKKISLEKDVPYQSLMKVWLSEKIKNEEKR